MKLYYYPVCPISNKIRILLHIMKIQYEEHKIISKHHAKQLENIDFKYLPILEDEGKMFFTNNSIKLHLLKKYNYRFLQEWYDDSKIQYYEDFFEQYMFFDIYKDAIYEKTQKIIVNNEYFVNNDIIKRGISHIDEYLSKLEEILSKHNWINQHESINDISGFAILAAMDYCFLVPWNSYLNIKNWYRRLKSKESYNFILQDRIVNFNPPAHYSSIDF